MHACRRGQQYLLDLRTVGTQAGTADDIRARFPGSRSLRASCNLAVAHGLSFHSGALGSVRGRGVAIRPLSGRTGAAPFEHAAHARHTAQCAHMYTFHRPPSLLGGLRPESLCTVDIQSSGGPASAELCRGTATRSVPTREKKSYMHHSTLSRTHCVRTAYDCVTRALRHRMLSLLGSQLKEVCE